MKFSEILESFNSRIPKQVISSTPHGNTIKASIGGRDIIFKSNISIGFDDEKVMIIDFFERHPNKNEPSYDKTGSGSEMQVFSFIFDCIKDEIIDHQPDEIEFDSVKADGNRTRLYKRMANKLPGYSLKNIRSGRAEDIFTLSRDK